MKKRMLQATAVMGILQLLLVGMLTASLLNGVEATAKKEKWPKGPKNLSAASAIVMEVGTGMILYEKNMHEKQYPASITKILTTLLSIENASMSDTVKFSEEAVFGIEPGSSHIGINVGERMNMEDCLYGIMLMSANEGCNGVAEHVSGSVKDFVKLMNQRAKELGCQNSHFVNPNGLFHKNHYTTAYDMALISRAAIQNDVFRKITGTKRYDIPETNKSKVRNLYNKHKMIYPMDYPQYGYEYTIGGKTGYTVLARWTLVTFAKKGDMELLCVVMRTGGPLPSEPNAYTDTIKLLNYGFENYTKHQVSENADAVLGDAGALFTNYNPLFDEEASPLRMEGDAGVVLPNQAALSDAEQTVEYYKGVEWVEGKNTIGRVTYSYGGKEVGSSNIVYDASQTVRLVGSEPVTDEVDEIERKELEEREKQKKEESGGTKDQIKTLAIVAAGLLVIAALTLLLVVRVRNEKKRERYRFYHKRTKNKEKKELHF